MQKNIGDVNRAEPTSIRRILIVDDHPLLRRGLCALIGVEPDLAVCGEAGSVSEALDSVATLHPDLAIVDLSLGDNDGLDLVKRLKNQNPELKILVCSVYDESLFAQRSIAAGAMGFINKKEATARIVEAIRQVLKGEWFVSEKVAQSTLRNLSSPNSSADASVDRLSHRELQVYRLIAKGLGSSKIAEHLNISVKTIESHKEKIKKKLNIASAGELTRHAIQWERDQS